jgi:hypothetical protein
MSEPDQRDLIRTAIAIATGSTFFLLFIFLSFHRLLADTGSPSVKIFALVVGLGVVAAVAGAIEYGGQPPEKRGYGFALALEGVLLVVLSALIWALASPIPLP